MMQKAWFYLEEVPYCSSRSSIKFQSHTAKKSSILTQNGRFRTVAPVWNHHWLWNGAKRLKQHKGGALLFFKVICQFLRSRGTKKITNLYPTWGFPGCNSSLTSPMDLKRCTKLDVVQKRYLLFFKVICQFSKSPGTANFDPNWAFPDCNSSLNMPMALKCCTKLNVV